VIGNGVIDSVASSDAVKPAITSVWNIISAACTTVRCSCS